MTLYFSFWGWDINAPNLKQLHDHPKTISKIFILMEQEYEYTSCCRNNMNIFDIVMNFSDKYQIPVTAIIGISSSTKLLHDPTDPRYRLLTVKHWDNYWFSTTLFHLNTSLTEQCNLTHPEKYEYSYVMLNGRPHYHRCVMIDAMHKRNLLSAGAISWNPHKDDECFKNTKELYIPNITWLTEQSGYATNDKCDKNTLLRYVNQYRVPFEYFKSFAQLVSESSVDHNMLTEKTSMALFHYMPFICIAPPYFHTKIIRDTYGFELYFELFDYSFDYEEDVHKRADMIAAEFEKICNMSDVDKHAMSKKLHNKLKRNHNKAVEIALDMNNVPAELIEICNKRAISRTPGGLSVGSPEIIEFIASKNIEPVNTDLSKYKRLFTFGCSFTSYEWPMWSDVMASQMPNATHINLGQAGSGNQLIAIRIAEANARYKFTKDDLVMVLWSTVCREDRYTDDHWWCVGNTFSNSSKLYTEKFTRKYCDPKGYLIRDLALIAMSEDYLKAAPCDALTMISVPFTHQQDLDDPSVHVVLELYDDLIRSYRPNMLDNLWGGVWQDGHKGDYHPTPLQWLTYLKSIKMPISKEAEAFANEAEQKLAMCSSDKKEIAKVFPELDISKSYHKF